MKKLKLLIGGVLSATLLLGACGNDEKQDAKQENKKEQVTKDKQNKEKAKAYKQNEKIKKQKQKAYQTRIAEEEQQNTQQDQTQVEQPPVKEAPVEQQAPDQTLSNMNEDGEDNRNGYGEDTVSPGYENQEQENQAYEEYKRGKQAQAEAGPSAVPGADMMDLSDEE